VPITDENLEERATLLAGQYRKQQPWYRTPHILVPVGMLRPSGAVLHSDTTLTGNGRSNR